MTGAVFSYALLAALATALLIAALTDLRARHIGNRLTAAVALAAPLWWLASGLTPQDMALQVALAGATLGVASLLFAIGQMGGGDVKLLSALALWFSPAPFLQMIILMAVLGGGASVAMAALNMTTGRSERFRDILAALAAFAWIWCAGAVLFALAFDRPIVSPSSAQALVTMVPAFWIIPVAGLAALIVVFIGLRHMMGRQKSRIEVPYGIAITTASLWVLGFVVLPTVRFAPLAT